MQPFDPCEAANNAAVHIGQSEESTLLILHTVRRKEHGFRTAEANTVAKSIICTTADLSRSTKKVRQLNTIWSQRTLEALVDVWLESRKSSAFADFSVLPR